MPPLHSLELAAMTGRAEWMTRPATGAETCHNLKKKCFKCNSANRRVVATASSW